MRIAFLISGLAELIAAIICYSAPNFIFENSTPYLLKLYGVNALVMGIINLLLFHYYEPSELVRKICLAMMFFHGAVAMMTYGFKNSELIYPHGAVLLHLALFIVFLIMYMRDLKPDGNPSV